MLYLSDYEKAAIREFEQTEFIHIFYRLLDHEIESDTEKTIENVPDDSREWLREIKGMKRARNIISKYLDKRA